MIKQSEFDEVREELSGWFYCLRENEVFLVQFIEEPSPSFPDATMMENDLNFFYTNELKNLLSKSLHSGLAASGIDSEIKYKKGLGVQINVNTDVYNRVRFFPVILNIDYETVIGFGVQAILQPSVTGANIPKTSEKIQFLTSFLQDKMTKGIQMMLGSSRINLELSTVDWLEV